MNLCFLMLETDREGYKLCFNADFTACLRSSSQKYQSYRLDGIGY